MCVARAAVSYAAHTHVLWCYVCFCLHLCVWVTYSGILCSPSCTIYLKSRTFRDDFQQERRDRERAVERCDSLQQMMADFERQSEKYKEENADLTEQLNVARQTIAQQVAELEVAKEEIAVKVAQVKQYQKQVEAYKKQVCSRNFLLQSSEPFYCS